MPCPVGPSWGLSNKAIISELRLITCNVWRLNLESIDKLLNFNPLSLPLLHAETFFFNKKLIVDMLVGTQYLSCHQYSDSHLLWTLDWLLWIQWRYKSAHQKSAHTSKVYIQLQQIHKYSQIYLKTLNNEQDVSRYNPSPQGALSLEMDNRLPCVFFCLASKLHSVAHMVL